MCFERCGEISEPAAPPGQGEISIAANGTSAGGLLRMGVGAREARHLPVDHFMRLLALDRNKDRAIGIMVSGTGMDGMLGLKAIKGESELPISVTSFFRDAEAFEALATPVLVKPEIKFIKR